jgi:hypothetical protein
VSLTARLGDGEAVATPPPPFSGRSAQADLVAGAALAGLAAFFLVGALRMPLETPLWTWFKAPGLVPGILATVLLVQAAALMIRGGRRFRAAAPQEGGGSLRQRASAWGAGRVALAMLFTVSFIIAMGRAPFGLLIVLLVFSMTLAFRGTTPLRAALVAVVAAITITVVFTRLFFIPLP